MKKLFTLFATSFILMTSFFAKAQAPIYHYTFDNTLNSLYNVATLTANSGFNSNFGYTTDRFGVANKAFKIYANTGALYNTSVSLLPQGTAARSFSLWAKFLSNNINMLLKYGAGLSTNETNNSYFGLTVSNTSEKLFGWANSSNTTQTYSTGQWYHYVVTYDGTTANIYRNGTLVLSEAKTWSTSGTALSIGLQNTGYYQMNAEIDDYQIYNRVLNANEALYLAAPPATSISPVSASNLQKYSADINYSVNASNLNTTTEIKYGTSAGSLSNTLTGATFTTNAAVMATTSLSNLISSTTYYYQIETTNSLGIKKTSAVLSFTTPNAGVSNNGLLGYYNFENNTNSHNGVHNFTPFAGYVAPNYVAQTINGKAAFVPSLGTILENTTLQPALTNTDFTIAFWEKKIDLSSGSNPLPTTFEMYGSYFWRYGSFSSMEYGMAVNTATPSFVTGGGFVVTTTPYLWKHIAFVKKKNASNNNILEYYVDGVLISTLPLGTAGEDFHQFNNKFTLFSGTYADGTGTLHPWKRTNGYLDEFYIFNRALNAQEIFEVKNNANGLILPIKLSSFNVNIKNSIANLNWATSQEINTSHFEVEYSNDGKEFSKVSTVLASGNSTVDKEYFSTHITKNNLYHYYRLKMIDIDGSFTYSNIIFIKEDIKTDKIKIYPTLINNTTVVSFYSDKATKNKISILNSVGQILMQNDFNVQQGYNNQILDMSNYKAGNYFVQINFCNGIKKTKQVVKN